MCPADDSHLTLDFARPFRDRPTITFFRKVVDYVTNPIGERGKPVADGFEYNSGTNRSTS